MIQALRLAGLLAVAVIGTSPVLAAEPPRPNIVYVVADDLGWKDVGFHGSEIETPSLDRLAADGVTFDQFYVQPMCTPTRAALMTGRYPLRYGLQSFVILPEQTYGLPLDERLLPEALKEAGYDTAIVGKWHLGHADMAYWPKQRGFDYQYGPMIGEIDYFTHLIHGVNDWFVNNQPLYEEGYSTTLIGDAAVRTRATIRCSSTLPSTRRTRPTRRRRSISTAIPTSPIRTARPMTRW
jgi:arylsulfatase A-like enzyme